MISTIFTMKKSIFFAALIMISIVARAQTTAIKPTDTAKLYNPSADAKADIANAVKLAAKEHKNVLLQIGGNWCNWCLRFNGLVTTDPELNKYVHDNYVVVHVNYSRENTNDKLMAELGYPQRFGFPVFAVLDAKGKRLHTQNSAYLGEGNDYSNAKILKFFKDWSPEALDPKTYEMAK
jgi:thioredoxin-related protein